MTNQSYFLEDTLAHQQQQQIKNNNSDNKEEAKNEKNNHTALIRTSGMRLPNNSSELLNAFNETNNLGNNKDTSCTTNNYQNLYQFSQEHIVSQCWQPPITRGSNYNQIRKDDIQKVRNQGNSNNFKSQEFQVQKIDFYQNQCQEQNNNFISENLRNEDDQADQDDYHSMTEQDFDGHDNGQESEESHDHLMDQDHELSQESQDQRNDNFSEEGNIPQSSISASPEDHSKLVSQNQAYTNQFLSNSNDDNEEDLRESNIIKSSHQTTEKSSICDLNFGQNSGMIVERNDRFIIFKMVPQSNSMNKYPQKDQPTPALGERLMGYQNNKVYHETVEDIISSESDMDTGSQNNPPRLQLEHDQMLSNSNSQSHGNSSIDESLFEENQVVQNEVRTMRNQLINQFMKQPKPPIGRKSEQTTPISQNQQKASMNFKLMTKNLSNNRLGEDQKLLENDYIDKSFKKSITAISRSSSDKFSKLQKLEKKNINDEKLDVGEFTLSKENINLIITQQNDLPGLKETKLKGNREMSDLVEKKKAEDCKPKILMKTQTDEQSEIQLNLNAPQQKEDTENDQLLQEYIMLKKKMKQMKHEPSNIQKDQPKQTKNEQIAMKYQESLINSHRLTSQPNMKNKPNLENDNRSSKEFQYQNNTLLITGASNDNYQNNNNLKPKNTSRTQITQISTKNKDNIHKNFSKFNDEQLSKIDTKREQSKNKISQRNSPIKTQDNKIKPKSKSRQQSKSNYYKKKLDHNSDTDEEKNIFNHQSREKSIMQIHLQKRQQNKKQTQVQKQSVKQIQRNQLSRQKKNRHQHSSEDEDDHDYSDNQQSLDCSKSNENIKSTYEAYSGSYYGNSRLNDIRNDSSYDDQEKDDNTDDYYSQGSSSQEISQNNSSDSQSSESSRRSDTHYRKRKRSHHKSRREEKKSRSRNRNKKSNQTYTQSDRQVKIKLHMHGDQYSGRRQDKQVAQDDFIQQQRQILQQQQYLMQLAQIPQQQMLLQQQLALQQQILLQPAISAQSTFSPNNLQQTVISQAKQLSQPLLQSTMQPQQVRSNSNNIQVIPNKQQFINEDISSRNMITNVSVSNMSNFLPNTTSYTTREVTGNNPSTKRDLLTHANTSTSIQYKPQSNLGQAISPRETNNNIINQFNQQILSRESQKQENYLNQLKNRFKTGGDLGTSSNIDIHDESLYSYQNPGGNIVSRNAQISQVNSSPIEHQQKPEYSRGYQQSNFQRPEHIEQRDNQEYKRRLGDASNFSIKPQFIPESRKHVRTNSYMDTTQERINRLKQNDELFEEDMDRFEQMRRKQKFDDQSRNSKENKQSYENSFERPQVHQKRTGDFGNMQIIERGNSPNSNSRNQYKMAKNFSRSPSLGDTGDQSMDEGVKASTTRQTMQKSPKAIEEDLQSTQNHTPINTVMINLSKKDTQQKGDQDKKGPQALFIGFEESKGVKDPFQNKPTLKPRDREKDFLRSKSQKGTTPTVKRAQGLQQRRSPDQRIQSKQQHDKQMRSPQIINQKKVKTIENLQVKTITIVPKKNESSLKKAVEGIKQKETFTLAVDLALSKQNVQKEMDDNKNSKGVVIEIFDQKKQKEQTPQEVSLAEMFMAKKKEALNKKQDQDQTSLPRQKAQEQDNQPVKKQEKTKAELAEIRRQMMKSKVKKHEDNYTGSQNDGESNTFEIGKDGKKRSKKDPKQDLMIRLAMGQKVQIDKKEMKKLTCKNYQNLPEIKKKKEEEQKKQEHLARKAATTEYMKQLNEKRKTLLKKKKSIIEDN